MESAKAKSTSIRRRALELCYLKKASHLGGAFSITDILAVLYDSYLNITPKTVEGPLRDRLFYSKGHACTALYATLEEFDFIKKSDLDTFTDNGSYFTSHVNHKINGVEFSTGSLGHALPVAAGVAYAGKCRNENYRVICILSDGELNEGSNWEALMFASHHNLNNLTVIVDYNKIQSFGRIEEILKLEPLNLKFQAFNCSVIEINGHSHLEIYSALNSSCSSGPKVIIAHTIKGKGVSFMEDKLEWHYKSPDQKQYEQALKELGTA